METINVIDGFREIHQLRNMCVVFIILHLVFAPIFASCYVFVIVSLT